MPSIVEICNLGLANLGTQSAIQSLDEKSKEAKECKRWYDVARRATLERHDWFFARSRKALSDHTIDPPDTWGYRYQWPVDCLALRKLPDPGDDTRAWPYFLEIASDGTRSILTTLEGAAAIYTRDEQNPTVFTPQFVLALGFSMAAFMAASLTSKESKQKMMYEAFEDAIAKAAMSSANQQTSLPPPEAPWIEGR